MNEYQDLLEAQSLPAPPRLHWGWVCLLSWLTGGLFGAIWMIVIGSWLRKVRGRSLAYVWAWIYLVFFILSAMTLRGMQDAIDFCGGAAFILDFVVAFLLRNELENAPIGLNLSGVMTFFFSPTYFQYHLRDFGLPRRTPLGEALHFAGNGAPPEANI